MLPAPLSVARPVALSTVSGSSSAGRSSEEGYPVHPASHSNQRLVPSPDSREPYDDLDSLPPTAVPRHAPGSNPFEQFSRSTGGGSNPAIRSMTAPVNYPGETQNPYRDSRGQAAHYNEHHFAEPDVYASPSHSSSPAPRNRATSQDRSRPQRGVSLADNGPVINNSDGVRRVARQSRRTSQAPAQNRYSRTSPTPAQSPPPGGYASPSQAYQLPPGAAPPRDFGNQQGYIGYSGTGGYIDS
jgi:chitin synthase